ncbi:hypothetical protein MSAN_02253900 [Mycena sanguinolenta]|uniref:Helicase ATP-binding domain-containing protein n=1 Tax=Mycena sanguinolenta TaxID=230812 RepID=A0A8H7CJM7_9AGAR|nr:hypothetical protein MSAN_02253900 [Mycena sanguinolenta]
MDLENFDDIDELDAPLSSENISVSAQQALEELDQRWFTSATRRARWMDLLGDYAGAELFLISGESLLQRVLDDPLLAIGRDDGSFQILHSYYILERILLEFVNRKANFEIVFWEANYHSTVNTGHSCFNVASRHLARSLLFEHLVKLDSVTVHTFNDLEDPSWLQFEITRRPMFVLVNDGGVSSKSDRFHKERALLQRLFLFQLVDGGMAIGLLNGAEFRDSKISTFVYHGEANRRTQQRLSNNILDAADRGRALLDAEVATSMPTQTISRLSAELPCTPIRSRLIRFSQRAVEDLQFEFSHQLLFLFLLHATILPDLSLPERARPSQELKPDLMKLLSNLFLPRVFLLVSHLPFDIDGRVFLFLISTVIIHPSTSFSDLVGSIAYEEARAVWSPLPIPDFRAFQRRYTDGRTNPAQVPGQTTRIYNLLPFNHPVFNFNSLSLPDASVGEETPTSSSHFDFGVRFSDTSHWHNSRSILPSHLGGDDHRVLDERQRLRENRSNQRFMATLQKSAATLTGALGTTLQQITIISTKNASKDSRTPKSQERGHSESWKSGKKGKAALNSTQQRREKIKQEKVASQEDVSYKWWLKELNEMSRLTTTDKVEKLRSLFRNKRSEEPMLGLEMRLYSVHLLLRQWIENTEPDSALVRDNFTIAIMQEVKAICDRNAMTKAAADVIDAVLTSLGFAGYSSSLTSPNLPDRPLAFPFENLLKSSSKKPRYKFMGITEHPIEWQLRLFGEFMDRSMDSAFDSRVSFKPDAWQREVLDCIDKRFSVLVIAPTSAGKTFISFYSMEKILRDSDDGILVYIAPTKALVTQIAAEIYARFKKTLASQSLWAIHTRDYRVNDPLKCQILVTVPEILATLLLSPPLARVWTPRLKSIILDEIHSIGQQEGGKLGLGTNHIDGSLPYCVRLLVSLLSSLSDYSRLRGLSATVGSPEDFSQWLESVQNAHGFKYRVIQHPHRYSHLRKFYYRIDEHTLPPQFTGLVSHRDTQRSLFLHPMSLMSFGTRSIPDDLALEASDTLTLYRALSQHAPGRYMSLNPQTFFRSDDGPRLLVQKDIILYERALKEALVPLLEASPGNNGSDIVSELQHPKLRSLEDPNMIPSRKRYIQNLIFLLSDLHVKDELPAILFSFDRTDCEIMAQVLLRTLKTAESNWRDEDPKWTEKIEQWKRWTARAKDRERAAAKAARRRKDDDDDERPGEHDYSWESSFDPSDPSPQFSFAGTTAYSKSDLAEHIQDLRRWAPDWALDALERGVGVHHAGMNKKYRNLIESLFRQGFIRVMIATDSPFLTALMYRQCSGRAGRRGFDLLGNVVFYGLPMERVQRLVLSRLPPLGGNFPLTPTLSLRLMNLLSGSNDAEVAVSAVQSILKLPRVSFVSDVGQAQLLHHMRFSIEYLRRSGLLDKDGKPLDLFSMAAHLYYHEPSNFALVALLRSGALHDLCNQNPIAAKKDFILVMAHLFGRRYISRVWANEKTLAAARNSPSMVVLPDLPKPVRDVWKYHDQQILQTFTGYALACSTQLEKEVGQDNRLPLSKISYAPLEQQDHSILRTRLRETAVRVVARSAFVANSGHTDVFGSIDELARSTRNDLHLTDNSIPSLKHLISQGEHLLNAYLLDFYIHGQVSTLAKANGIRRGDVWYLLQDFSLSLRTIQTSLRKLFLAIPGNATEDPDAVDPQLHDPAEMEEREDEDETETGGELEGDFERPAGVSDGDWKLYKIASGALKDFDEKFRAMWA